ncbi:hypothetical protein TNCV_526821 [Trichonephila clavipes]|nr:hypothetical protein TNCV_526821 [Trichonephila clavipes]
MKTKPLFQPDAVSLLLKIFTLTEDCSTSMETGVLSDTSTPYLELSKPCDVFLVWGVEEVWPWKAGANGEQQSSSG